MAKLIAVETPVEIPVFAGYFAFLGFSPRYHHNLLHDSSGSFADKLGFCR